MTATVRRQISLVIAVALWLTASASTSIAAAPDDDPPRPLTRPRVTGTPHVGATLAAARGTWAGERPMRLRAQWLRCASNGGGCAPISGATAARYTTTSSDVGATIRLRVTAENDDGRRTTTSAPTAPVAEPSFVVAAAGDIACDTTEAVPGACHHQATSDILVSADLDAVLPLGDLQYPGGDRADFDDFYAPSWGRVRDVTFPVPGNHEYGTPGAAGYFSYFADRTSAPGWYSFDIGAWHLIALNSNCSAVGGCGPDAPQTQWLRADLAEHPSRCTLAYWHHPRFSSGNVHGSDPAFQPWWDALYEAGADVVLVGHEHHYERFAPQTPTGAPDGARGIREFVVGTGGRSVYGFGSGAPNSEVRDSGTFGVLVLTLYADRYDWRFVPEAGATFTDSGTTACH